MKETQFQIQPLYIVPVNPHILTILQQILTGGKQQNTVIRAICESSRLQQSNLWQIPVPEDFFNETFGQLFEYLALKRNLIPLGLYRLPNAMDNTKAYTFTNPPKDTRLTHRDKVFVLAHEIPNDLLTDNFKTDDEDVIKIPKPIQKIIDKPGIKSIFDDKKIDSSHRKTYQNQIKPKTELQQQLETGKSKANLDLENLNSASATYLILEQVNKQIGKIQDEMDQLKENIDKQNDEILQKVKTALRQELATLTQYEN
ncbi:hypothetical protein PPERSA_02725 [Pseudocohnilembus persalinus]|uniref:Ca2+-activated K+ channel Slowpoke-like C-terminal domain-containing protein n=1 Tax=Pseudocohnilembus persalinus TaxID=266149 RepID=A0A0V0R5S2_PSEPJ|nr:hypothetical protein PPERSA_02725 [Pseudocohnilembus persalinus]|eukprot:KRX09853.1 hypothetical protein PPERSA_02725 [Pseudocohnilembus persalinus]